MTTFSNLIIYIIIPCSKLSMTSTSHPVSVQPLSHLIGHLRVISQKYLIIPVNSNHLASGLSELVFGVPETLGFISDILRSEGKVELLHYDSMFCQYPSLGRTQSTSWVHLLSTRYSTMDSILQSGTSNTEALGQSSDWHFCVDSVAIHGCKELLIIAESRLRCLRLGAGHNSWEIGQEEAKPIRNQRDWLRVRIQKWVAGCWVAVSQSRPLRSTFGAPFMLHNNADQTRYVFHVIVRGFSVNSMKLQSCNILWLKHEHQNIQKVAGCPVKHVIPKSQRSFKLSIFGKRNP